MKPLIIFEMANNHLGKTDIGRGIIMEHTKVALAHQQFRYAFKFQYRDWSAFCHPAYRDRIDIPYVRRFRECALKDEEFLYLKHMAADNGFVTMCTPFDEASVDKVTEHGYDALKIGSPSIKDIDLLWKIRSAWTGPVYASLGGAEVSDITLVYEAFLNRPLTLMHCVSEYPTAPHHLMIGQIRYIAEKWFLADVGFSTHEPPGEMGCVLALAAGAEVIEWHVGLNPAPNGYTLTPDQSRERLSHLVRALEILGDHTQRHAGESPVQFQRTKTEEGLWWKPRAPQL